MTRRGAWAVLAAAWVVTVAVYLVGHAISDRTPTGDEPAYLMMAQSLALDGDLDLAGDMTDAERASAILPGVDALTVDGADFRGDGRYRPVYPPATAVLVLPAVGIARTFDVYLVSVARVEMALLAGVASVLLLVLAWEVTGGSRWRTALAWAAATLTIPLLPFGSQIYPELLALILVTGSVLGLRRPPSLRTAAVVGVSAALLPWLQVRFFPLAGALVVAELVRRRRLVAAAVAPPVVSWLAFAAYSQHLYGSPWPNAAYSERVSPPVLDTLWAEGIGNFLSASSGWVPFTPIALLAIAACAVSLRRRVSAGVVVAVGFVAYVILIGATSWQGGTMPARFLVVAVPVVVIGVARLTQSPSTAVVRVTVALVALSLVIGIASPFARETLIDDPGYSDAPVAHWLAPLYPTLINDAADTVLGFAVEPATAAHTTGALRTVDGVEAIVATEGTDEAGLVTYGPYARVHNGRWAARYRIKVDGEACIDVVSAFGARVLAERCLDGETGWREETLEFTSGRRSLLETRVVWEGEGEVAMGGIAVTPLEDLRPERGWPWVLGWTAVFVAAVVWLRRRLT